MIDRVPSVESTPSRGGELISSVQVMRGLAAIAVAFYHVHIILAQPEYGGHDLFRSVAGKGWLGVNFFFVLSGFIILYAHMEDRGRPDRAPRYLWRRFARLYPVYWVFLTLYILASLFGLGSARFSLSLPNLASAYLLVNLHEPLTLPLQVAWTLFYEVIFYAFFVVLILHRVIGLGAMAVWFVAILVNSFYLGNTAMGAFHIWNAYFFAGMAAYLLYRRIPARFGYAIALAGLAGLVVALATIVEPRIDPMQKKPLAMALLAPPFALILLGGALIEKHQRLAMPRLLLLFGAASYAIYLVHSPAISLLAMIHMRLLGGAWPPLLLFALASVISIFAGIVAHLIVERPILAALRRFGRRFDAPAERRG